MVMNVGMLKAPEYRQGLGNRMDGRSNVWNSKRNQHQRCMPCNQCTLSETTLRRLDLPAMQLYMVAYIASKGLTTVECYW
jgi:hypothetical protein